MLVSSIGYFNVNKTSIADSGVKNQTNKKSSSEKFGQVDLKQNNTVYAKKNNGILMNIIKSVFGLQKDESSQFLDMIV